MEEIFNATGFYTYAAAAVAYLGLAIFLLSVHGESKARRNLACVLLVSVIWALTHCYAYWQGGRAFVFLSLVEYLRNSAWIFLFLYMLSALALAQQAVKFSRLAAIVFSVFFGLLLIVELVHLGYAFGYVEMTLGVTFFQYEKLIQAILVVLMVENLYRSTLPENRWSIRYLCLAVVALYVYDFLLYADNILFTAIGPVLYEARGLINLLLIPLIGVSALRMTDKTPKFQISRKLAFHTITLIGSGAYLIGMSAAGYFLREYGGRWGNLLQATVLVLAALGLVVILASGKFRAWLRVVMSKHLFRYKYDYREEWLRFIRTISSSDHHYGLRERTIQAVADIMDSPGGALWLKERPDSFVLSAKWNMHPRQDNELPVSAPFIEFMEREEWIVDLEEVDDGKISGTNCPIPDCILTEPGVWLVLPLIHHDRMVGFMVLQEPRVARDLNWESKDLLKIVGRQVASYLAEQIAEKALAEAREFEGFNKRFAFVIHDIKNLASQLSLLVKNAEKHADNPEFQRDMLLTVQDSARKMNDLLSRITVVQEPSKEKRREVHDLVITLEALLHRYRQSGTEIRFENGYDEMKVLGDPESLETIFMHLIQNGIDACDEQRCEVQVSLSAEEDYAIIRVKDNGKGMDEAFIRDELFRPFRSTKEKGYGIGAYESREMIRRMGGRLDVKSTPGKGTVMTVYLKKADELELNEGR
ncbi:XrtA/PEP-CTERM system histidine kinase PrsK [Luteithermobacter gelatinilyticus]|uniref:XrtA/PEP-CTERM system histidine kinase PrsK n=1 Tax=Luteithermobacter gelatinilyticus TaxID=2582913 RepID=UPI001106FBD2|nr:XrtA/PEP-CTERM system histidine kinase PrsK [Luteithermobacter gelatinilyticus]